MSSAPVQLVTEPTPPEPVPVPAAPKGRRLGWLDALRGFAALCVVFEHMSSHVLQHVRSDLYTWFNAGQYGVFVFFLASGYIIPASLERKGSVRGFWVSRAFRLYPLYIVGIAVSLVAWKTGFGPIHGANTQPKTWVYSLPFMMSNMIDGANVPNVIWTLSFEMVFYFLLSALFTFRVHRHSSGYALTAAIGAVVLGGILPIHGLSHAIGNRRVSIAADILLFTGLALAVSGRRVPRAVGAALAAATGLTLLLFNTDYPYNWSGLTILALMFTGTMLYRAERGEFGRVKAAVIAVVVFALAIVAGVWHSMMWHMNAAGQRQFDLQWISCLVLAGGTFAVGMALRHRTVPRVLAWLGLVSYSVYMLHPIVLNAVYGTFHVFRRPHPFPIQVLLAAGILAVVLTCSALTYYLVESPMQRVGHRFARLLQARFGSDAIAESVAVPDAPAVPAEADLTAGADLTAQANVTAEPAGDPMRDSPHHHTGPHGHANPRGRTGPVSQDAAG